MRVCKTNTSGLTEIGDALGQRDLVFAVVVCDEFVQTQGTLRWDDDVRAMREVVGVHCSSDLITEESLSESTNARVSVHVLESRELSVLCRE